MADAAPAARQRATAAANAIPRSIMCFMCFPRPVNERAFPDTAIIAHAAAE